MIHTSNVRVVEIRNFFKRVRKLVNSLIISIAFLSFVYFVYWAAVMSDEMVLDYTAKYFSPLANFFFQNDTSVDIYRSTAIILAFLIIPCNFMYFIADKIEEKLIQRENKIDEIIEQNRKKQEKINNLMQYDIINSYSICLSLDYESEKNITDETKITLNNVVFNKIKNILKIAFPEIKVHQGDALIITSFDFDKYDAIYSTVLRALAKVKNVVEGKYELKIIPNTFSDAYVNNKTLSQIHHSNSEIKKLNFKNRALSSATFLKKYKYLNHNKYAGIPIGEYALFKDNSTSTYELNVVYKNLSQTLASIS